MQVAFISDVHSNLEALQAVLAGIGTEPIFCLGDLVGYGADPNGVVELLRKRDVAAVLGNHDYAALTGDTGNFSTRAALAARWTKKMLAVENADFLKGLSRATTLELGAVRLYLTHGSPDDPLWEYVAPVTHSQLFGHYLTKLGVKGIALGHTHIPYSWSGPEGSVFNPGSVGQPRDGNWKASYAMASANENGLVIEHRRVEYDVEKAAEKIRTAGLPGELASRLLAGR